MRKVILGLNPFMPDSLVLLESQVFSVVGHFRQRRIGSDEAGGILLGHRRGAHLHVVDATCPAAGDRGSRTSFHRTSKPHHASALSRWRSSGKKLDYIGEWHTHPERSPAPSLIDLQAWAEICRNRAVPMIFLILGTDATDWVGIGTLRGVQPVHLLN
ncbi:MAG: Mov34/MPN/PAD-1 family protein [Rhodanobacteraceae bacterium]|nr:Mov34/MPN/PAD-1 family protein [Rhodanobacteraceae bacterium]